jgi:hypothetical protein
VIPLWAQYIILIAASTYLWEKFSKGIETWWAERQETRRKMREWREEDQKNDLSRRRADYAFEKYNHRLAAGDTPLEACAAFDVAVAWAERNIH